MIQPSSIASHLQTYLPMFTDLFSKSLTVTSAVCGTGNVISVNAVAHGMTSGDSIVVSAGTIRNSVSNVSISGDIATITTDYNHDFITPKFSNDIDSISLDGFTPSLWNADHQLLSVDERKILNIVAPDSLIPSVNGYIKESRQILGFFSITVIDADNFTYTVSNISPLPEGIIDNIKIITQFYVYVASSADRAADIYTNNLSGKNCIFIVMGDMDVSKNSNTTTDAVSGFMSQDLQLSTFLSNFETIIFIPVDEDLGASQAIESAYGEIFISLLSIFQGYGFSSQRERTPYVTAITGHGPGLDNNPAYYTHVYSWQAPSMVTVQDGFNVKIGPVSVVFEKISQTWNLNNDAHAQLIANTILI